MEDCYPKLLVASLGSLSLPFGNFGSRSLTRAPTPRGLTTCLAAELSRSGLFMPSCSTPCTPSRSSVGLEKSSICFRCNCPTFNLADPEDPYGYRNGIVGVEPESPKIRYLDSLDIWVVFRCSSGIARFLSPL